MIRRELRLGLPAVGLALLAILMATCGGSSRSASPSVRPIDEILASPVEIVELSPESAVVRVDTDIDVICSVVYGKDDRYGGQSTDLDMAGLPHGQHRAPLRGLQPDTVYHYRLQGTGPDGSFYVSEDLTFRTPPDEDQSPDYGRNVAGLAEGARVIEVSSTFGNANAWDAKNAIDGDPQTEWSSASDGDAAYITIELAAQYDLTAIGFWTRTMGSTGQITRFRVVAGDGAVLGTFDLPDASRMYVFPVSASARVLRFEVVASSGGNTGAVELAAFTRE